MNLLTWLFGDEENAQRAAEADAKLRELNRARYGVDYVTADDWSNPAKQEQQIDDAFSEGWDDGKANVQKTVGSVFGVAGDTIKAALGGIPLWTWLIGIGAIWLWLGKPGWQILRPK